MQPFHFFRALFGTGNGFVCIAVKSGSFRESFFRFPEQLREMHEFVERSKYGGNTYFCPQLLSEPKRVKTSVSQATCVWADLDTCSPKELLVTPTIALETSPGRYQAFWVFDEPRAPEDAEDIARRIAYYHADQGADRSGWDLTQLLRIPGTRNFKYGEGATAPEVRVVESNENKYRPDDFADYPQASGLEYVDAPLPEFVVESGSAILERHRFKLAYGTHQLFYGGPPEGMDRSTALYRLEMLCFESDMRPEDVFQVARDASFNKWKDRPDLLWKDVCRARANHERNEKEFQRHVEFNAESVIDLTETEIKDLEKGQTFVERYINWARKTGDAAISYHQASAFVLLSSNLSGTICLPTSFGTIVPNLWFLILADSTTTRKSTAINLALDFITDIDEDIVLATDGSMEGLSTALAARSGKVSLFMRDEFTGMIEQMTKKDYMAGMPEFFTHLYDGKLVKRMLRKEQIVIRNPRLVIFAGGIRSRMQTLLSFQHVLSGFLPRFVLITARTDPSKIRPLGRPTEHDTSGKDSIRSELLDIRSRYQAIRPITIDGKVTGVTEEPYAFDLTDDAWTRYNHFDARLTRAASDSGELRDILLPTYTRLGLSILKAAMLIAASRSTSERPIVEEEDIMRAAYYGEGWRQHAYDIVTSVGRGPMEHKIELVSNALMKALDHRLPRSRIMQAYHLTSQEMTLIVKTMEERGLINATQQGRQQWLQWLGADEKPPEFIYVGGKKK